MKKKTILGLLAVIVTAFTINLANAQTESTNESYGCYEPFDSVCAKVILENGTTVTYYGTCKC